MPYASKTTRRRADRDRKRARRAGLPPGKKGVRLPALPPLGDDVDLEAARGWTRLVARLARLVYESKPAAVPLLLARVRVLARLAEVGLRAIETADLEERIGALEERERRRVERESSHDGAPWT